MLNSTKEALHVKSKSHLATVKYLVAHASMQCQLVKFQETFCLKNHSHWMNSSKHTAHIRGRMLGNYKMPLRNREVCKNTKLDTVTTA